MSPHLPTYRPHTPSLAATAMRGAKALIKSAAQEAALEACRESVEKKRAKYDEALERTFENAGLFECRIHFYY